MDSAGYILVIVNLLLGFGVALPVSRRFAVVTGRSGKFTKRYAILIGVYFIECVAFSAGMATDIFSIALAFVWGGILGHLVRRSQFPPRELIKTAFIFSLYTSLPALSFITVPIIVSVFGEWSILTAEAGLRFGIPDFFPWPMNTILGFCLVVALVPLVLKTFVTTGIVSLFIRSGGKAKGEESLIRNTI